MLCICRNSDGISIRISVSTSASEDISALEDHKCATLKSDEQNLRLTYSDSDQDHNHVISTQERQNKLKPRTL